MIANDDSRLQADSWRELIDLVWGLATEIEVGTIYLGHESPGQKPSCWVLRQKSRPDSICRQVLGAVLHSGYEQGEKKLIVVLIIVVVIVICYQY